MIFSFLNGFMQRRQMSRLICWKRRIYRLPYLPLDGSMRLSNHQIIRLLKLSKSLVSRFPYLLSLIFLLLRYISFLFSLDFSLLEFSWFGFVVGGAWWRNLGELHKIILKHYHSTQILIRLKLLLKKNWKKKNPSFFWQVLLSR